MKTQCCATCKYSRWWLTPKGRIKKDAIGTCVVELPIIPSLPSCVTDVYGYKATPNRGRIHADQGSDCPLWEENQGKPISEL